MVAKFKIEKIIAIAFLWAASYSFGNPQLNKTGIRVMFYNVENLFHPSNDSLKNDDEFTKEGMRYWSYKRYNDKLAKIGKTILAIGEWEPPAVIGLCEVENLQCLKDLVYNSPIKKWNYQIVHEESGDNRGIDVAFLYRKDLVKEIHHHPFVLNFGPNSRPTRDILYLKTLVNKDTVHFFVNHWPSRYGGQLETEDKRNFAAKTLREKFDSLLTVNPMAKIVAFGDFNDHPDDESMKNILRAKKDLSSAQETDLINLIWQYEDQGLGTHKFNHQWGVLDQIIIPQHMLTDSSSIHTTMNAAQIFKANYLLETEKDGVGQTPNRTYIGFQYHGGYSDHLPIYLDLFFP